MMNRMGEVCRLLGLDLFVKFNIAPASYKQPHFMHTEQERNPYYFTDEGLLNCLGHSGGYTSDVLRALITGELVLTVLPEDQQFNHN